MANDPPARQGMSRMNRNLIWLILMIGVALSALVVWRYTMLVSTESVFAQVTGTITYREKVSLPPRSTVEINLADISLADAPANIISTRIMDNAGQVPISFSLDYDEANIDERQRYVIQARISIDGQLAFINDTVYPVITHGAGNEAHLVLAHIQRETDFPVNSEAAAGLIDSRRDDLIQLDGTLLTGEASITYRAYRDHEPGGDIVLIEEKREMGLYGNAVVAIYYSGGRPFRYTETGQRRSVSEEGQAGLDDITVLFEFDQESNVTGKAKTVNGVAVEPDDSEITGAYDHARFLMEESRLLIIE